MVDPAAPVPAALPIAEADPIRWWQSSTMWSGVGQIALGLALIVAAAAGVVPGDWSAYGVTQIGLGLATLRGRIMAVQPIGRV